MNIAYFSNQFAMQTGHGIARYAKELFHAIQSTQSDIQLIPTATWSDYTTEALAEYKNETGLKLLPWGKRWTPLFWTFLKWPSIETWFDEKPDIVHNTSLGFPVTTNKKYIVTIHDLGHIVHPEFFPDQHPWIMKRSLDYTLKKADAIVCVSQATANELEEYVGHSLKDRIFVVHEGVDLCFFDLPDLGTLSPFQKQFNPDAPFILAVGKLSPRKNTERIIKALASCKDEIPHHLVMVGGSIHDQDLVSKLTADLGLGKRVHQLGFVTDEQLHALYAKADVFVYPSLYEGFGLTILEAMAAGCPVITSNISSMPEVAGDDALLVDPYSVESISEGILSICQNESMKDKLIPMAKKRAKTFHWNKTAESMAAIYKMVG